MVMPEDAGVQQLLDDYEHVPPAYRSGLLKLVHVYREQFEYDDIDPVESVRQGLEDIRAGRVHPIENLWDDVKAGL